MNLPAPILTAAIYLACYLFGAVNFSLIAARLFLNKDLRQAGSGNPGFTNLLRLGNRKIAIVVLLLDITRGWLTLFLCQRIPVDIHWPFVAFALVLGNLFPVFHRFKGGKGIAMSMGAVLAICPWAALAGVIALIVMITLWKKISVGSLSFLFCATITAVLLAPAQIWIVCVGLTVTGIWTHRGNIQRLIAGTEPRFTSKK